MEGQGQVNGNAPALFSRIHPGTAGDFLHPGAPACIFLGILAIPFIGNTQVDAAVLHVIQGTFDIGGQAGDTSAPFHLAHAAAEADGIGRHHTQLRGNIGQFYIALGPLVKEIGSQVNPHAAAHLLVNVLEGFATQVMDGVAGIGSAFGQGFIAYIYGIVTLFFNGGSPDGADRFFALAGGMDLSGRSFLERKVVSCIYGAEIGKPLSRILPVALFLIAAAGAHGGAPALREGGIIVANDLAGLDVPLARGEHHGAGILQHGNKEG